MIQIGSARRRSPAQRENFVGQISDGGFYRGRRRCSPGLKNQLISVAVGALISALIVVVAIAALPTEDIRKTSRPRPDALAEVGFVPGRAAPADRASRDHLATTSQSAPVIWLLPLRTYTVTSKFGPRWGRTHAGIDLSARTGEPILAVSTGKVVLARWNSGYGNNVVLDHGRGITTVYGHASRLLVNEGQSVQAGDEIAQVGNTGYSFGSHLHLEVRTNNRQLEPTRYLRARGVDIIKHTEAVNG